MVNNIFAILLFLIVQLNCSLGNHKTLFFSFFNNSTYSAAHCSTSHGCVLIAALVNCFRILGNSGGMLICWAQYIVSGGGITLLYFKKVSTNKTVKISLNT